MATVYARMEFTDENGKHEIGEKLEQPRDTDEQKAEYERRKAYGLISDNPVNVGTESETGSSSRRRQRD